MKTCKVTMRVMMICFKKHYNRGEIKMIKLRDEIADYVLKELLPGAVHDAEKAIEGTGCSVVIVGGVCVQRCLAGAKSSVGRATWTKVMGDVTTDDVDLKFAVPRGAARGAAKKALAARDALLARVVEGLRAHGHDAAIDDKLTKHEMASVRAAVVKSVVLLKLGESPRSVLDTGLWKEPLEWEIDPRDGMKYATCEFAYRDTLRMLSFRLSLFAKKRTMHELYKLYRYVVKFMALYLVMGHVGSLPASMKSLYEAVRERMGALDPRAIEDGIAATRRVKYDEGEVKRASEMVAALLRRGVAPPPDAPRI